MFCNCGVIHVNKDKIKEDEIFEIAINAGAKDCLTLYNIFEVITEKEDFYKVFSLFIPIPVFLSLHIPISV